MRKGFQIFRVQEADRPQTLIWLQGQDLAGYSCILQTHCVMTIKDKMP